MARPGGNAAKTAKVQRIFFFQFMNHTSSKRLPQADEKLRRIETRDRIQVAANIEPYRPDRGLITQAQAHGIAISRKEVLYADARVHVPSVIEGCSAQLGQDAQGKAELGVQDDQLRAANRDRNLRTRSEIRGIAAHRYGTLGPGAIERKSTQRAAAAGEESLTQRNLCPS